MWSFIFISCFSFSEKENVKVILSFGLCKNSLWGNRHIFSIFLLLTTTNIPRHYIQHTHCLPFFLSLFLSRRWRESYHLWTLVFRIICGHWYSERKGSVQNFLFAAQKCNRHVREKKSPRHSHQGNSGQFLGG